VGNQKIDKLVKICQNIVLEGWNNKVSKIILSERSRGYCIVILYPVVIVMLAMIGEWVFGASHATARGILGEDLRFLPPAYQENDPEIMPFPEEQHFLSVPPGTIEVALKRNVFIKATDKEGSTHSGSGGRIGHGLVLTARHLVFEVFESQIPHTEITVDNVAAIIVAEDLVNDIAILRVPDDGFLPVDVSYHEDQVKVNTAVVIVGNPGGKKNTLKTGTVSRLESPENGSGVFEVRVFADHGLSGATVYTAEGKVIGVILGDPDGNNCFGMVRNTIPVQRLLNTLKSTP
jgi:S1-C subfamily serine protease